MPTENPCLNRSLDCNQRRGCVETGAVSIFAFLVSILLKIEKKTSEIANCTRLGAVLLVNCTELSAFLHKICTEWSAYLQNIRIFVKEFIDISE